MTSRELVTATLEFKNYGGRVPRQMWTLPWAALHHGDMIAKIERDFPSDFTGTHGYLRQWPKTQGDPYKIGTYTDEWGCIFENIQDGVIGEVKTPLVHPDDENWEDTSKIHIPTELLAIDKGKINEFCASTHQFVMAGCTPRPFEQLQFIRGTENLFVDFMTMPEGLLRFMREIHEYYCALLEVWAQTDVDALSFMDDWGTQQSLLISPALWVKLFYPMYRDYIAIAKKHNKKIFMHSDGNTLSILPYLIELGLDAINTQIFCIGIEKLAQFKGKITFWGEMDRQHLLCYATAQEVRAAVRQVRNTLWQNGGCIAQCEFGAGSRPENVYALYDEWNQF